MDGFSTDLFQSQWVSASRKIPRARQKLMIVLHGRGDSLRAFSDIKNEMRLPEFNYLLLNAPRRFSDGFSWGSLMPRRDSEIRLVRDKLFQLVNDLVKDGWATEQIFWMGHSQGCLIVGDLVMHHPKAFGGVIGVSGYLRFFRGWRARIGRSGARRTPWLLTHGRHDRIIRPDEIRQDIMELTSGSVPVAYREFAKGHDFDYNDEVPFIRQWTRLRPAQRLRTGRPERWLPDIAT